MKDVEVSPDLTVTFVGGSARWEDVYLKLDAMKLAVIGRRVYKVGIETLILRGESLIPYLSTE